MKDYGPTIDDAYEEDLKASRGKLLLRLNGRLVQTFDDTPSGREHCDKAAAELMDEGDVSVDRMGAGGLAVASQDPKGPQQSGGRERPVPAPLRLTGRERSKKYLFRRLWAETRRTGLDDAVKRHPAGGTLTALTDRCPVHPAYLWWECPTCSERGD